MTNAEPAGAGTAEQRATIGKRAIVLQLLTDIDTIAPIPTENVDAVIAAIDHAITAAESRAMERCAKIARDRLDDIGRTIEADFTGDSWGRLAAQRQIVGEIMAAIRSSIKPPGEEE